MQHVSFALKQHHKLKGLAKCRADVAWPLHSGVSCEQLTSSGPSFCICVTNIRFAGRTFPRVRCVFTAVT